MDGFVISLHQDNSQELKYWAVNSLVTDLNDAELISDVAVARSSASALQIQHLDSLVTVHPAFKGIQLKTPLNVAANI